MFKLYDSSQFNSLPDFELASTRPASVLRMAQRCGQVLCRYGCQELLAICLLHKHFDLASNERLVRIWDDRKNAHAVPMTAEAAGDALPWVWRFCEGTSGLGWYPVEYVQATPGARGLYTILRRCDHAFSDLTQVLLQHELEGVFGVAALYANDGLQIEDHEQTVETSSASPRRLDLTVTPRAASEDSADATVTLYRWNDIETHQPVQEFR